MRFDPLAGMKSDCYSFRVPQPGLRERKKALTRAQILRSADGLFAKYGFDAVTLERVADECLVSVKTLLRYFPTKEALALARNHEDLERFKGEIARRDTSVLSYWRALIETNALDMARQLDWLRRHMNMIHASPGLEAHLTAIQRKYEGLLAAAIAEEMGDDSVAPRVLAAMLVHGNAAVVDHWYTTGAPWDVKTFLAVADCVAEMIGTRFFLTGRWPVATGQQ